MPGILPMKVIRVGSSAQSRIAQACDRCRSKKIRCDGMRPCCTQCANVGFECKTSDKLSRRAFPRGYTESLEDRVRGLEAEVKELKDLLDEKDEKIDMLSRIRSFSPQSRKNSTSASPPVSANLKEVAKEEIVEEVIEVIPPRIDASLAPLATSTTPSFIESFNAKVSASGRKCHDIKSSNLKVAVQSCTASNPARKNASKTPPPRLLSDQFVNIFFQEWAPLFPIISRSSFLKKYQEFLSDSDSSHWHNRKHDVAQMYLVFDIASHSLKVSARQNIASFEQEWRKAMQAMPSTPSITTLQCHILAQLSYLLKDDQKRFLRHRASGVTICHQLGLQLSQASLPLEPLERETRKRAFWAQYIVDRFGAASCGVPMLLQELDIGAEYPADADDENITISGIQESSPGQVTKTSNFIAMIQITRILTKVLEDLHRPGTKYNLTVKKASDLLEELDSWIAQLPGHLRLRFDKDKPSTGIISDRSPLLAMAEFYIRMLINRPLMCYGVGNTASAAIIASSNAAKRVGQICELLDERRMNYTFPVNKPDLLLTAGFTLLWQSIELAPESKLVKDNQRSLALISRMLYRETEAVGIEFAKIISSLFVAGPTSESQTKSASVEKSKPPQKPTQKPMAAPERVPKSTRKHLQAIASRFSSSSFGTRSKPDDGNDQRQPSYLPSAHLVTHHRATSTVSVSSAQSEPPFPALSPTNSAGSNPRRPVNLDFFSVGNDSAATLPNFPSKQNSNSTNWEQMLASMDSGDSNIYTGIFGGIPANDTFSLHSLDGPLNVSDIDPSIISSQVTESVSGSNPTFTPSTFVQDSSIWSQQLPLSDSAGLEIDDIIKRFNPPPISCTSEEESLSSLGEDLMSQSATSVSGNSRAMSTSVYSDHSAYEDKRRSNSVDYGNGQTAHPVDATTCGLNEGFGNDNMNEQVYDDSNYGAIVIPNEYGIGF